MYTKKELRKLYRQLRQDIPNKEELSSNIHASFLSLLPKESKHIGIYVSLEEEVDTVKLIHKLLNMNHSVYVPITKEELYFQKIKSLDDLSYRNVYGIKEPIYNKKLVYPGNLLDYLVIPGIVFDEEKYRIGFGKGYYDQYCAKYQGFMKVGLAFNLQVIKEMPHDDYDIPLDLLITETFLYK